MVLEIAYVSILPGQEEAFEASSGATAASA